MFDHWGGSATVAGTLTLGHGLTGRGEYYLFNVDTTLTVSGDEIIGENGIGYFKQDGGTNTVSDALVLSAEVDSRGTYDLERGSLHTTKTVVSARGQEGVFNQSGGSHVVTDNLEIGLQLDSVGRYNMIGGTLTANDLHIGENGTGMFFQDYQAVTPDGSVNIAGELFLGRNINDGAKAYGYYQLLYGALNVGWAERIGVEGDAEFDQDGGSNITHDLIIADLSGSTGKYTMMGGTLEAGPLEGGSIIVGNGGVGEFYLADGDILAGNMDVGVTGDGKFTQSWGTNTVFNNLVLSRETGSKGEYLLYSGTLATGQTHVSAYGTEGLFFQSGGLHTTDTLVLGYNSGGSGEYGLYGGNLNAGTERIGLEGSGIFLNFEGTNTVRGDLILGQQEGSSGFYTLTDDGVLKVKGDEYVGQAGFGKFDMFGFGDLTHTVDGGLYVGNASGGTGEFYQSAGTTNVNGGYQIWESFDGSWKQYAGLVLGKSGGSGTYELTGGALNVVNATIVGADGNGVFTLSDWGAGSSVTTHTTGELYVGYDTNAVDFGAMGTYNLEGYGNLIVTGFTVIGGKDYGKVGRGEFNQSGGTHTTGGLFLGDNSDSSGAYNLYDGELNVGDWEVIGGVGTGNFYQSGGTHTTNGDVTIGGNGTYWMTGGDFQAGDNIVNDGLFHMEIAVGAGSITATTFINNGTLEGTGTIAASVVNNGIISAGNSPGIMTINGNLVLGDSGTLLFELGGTTQGTEYDYLHVIEMAALGGTLDVDLFDLGDGMFNPVIGDSFQILVADGGIENFFSNYLLPTLSNGQKWEVAYNDYDVTLHVNAVPVPPAVLLLASGLTSLFMIKRRKA